MDNHTVLWDLVKKVILSRIGNASDEYINKIVDRTINNLKMNDTVNKSDQCGGQLKDLVTLYADEYHPYCAILICVLGIIANSLNVMVLTRKDMAAAPINRILTALALADMLLMFEYIPFSVYYMYDSQEKILPYYGAVFILLHMHVTQILHTTSICLTLTLAIWRYLAIGFIEKNHVLCSHQRCTLAITICFILPIFLCIPQYATFKIDSLTIMEDGVLFTLYSVGLTDLVNKHKTLLKVCFWLYSIFLKLLPCVILIIISIWLIRTLFKAKKGRQVLKGYDSNLLNGNDHKRLSKYERRADRTTKMLIVILFLFLLTEMPQGLFGLVIALKGKELFLTCYQHYGEIMDMCALLNGSINFILYCCMNRMFRVTFGQLFRNKILKRWVQPAASDTPTVTIATSKTTIV